MTVEDRVAEVASRYDGEDDEAARLTEATLRRLAYRRRRGARECGRCREAKPVSDFGLDARERDGLHRLCRPCRKPGPLL